MPATHDPAGPVTRLELDPQSLARSCHEAMILAALADEPRHGYQLALEIEERSGGTFRFNHGTLYPILHKLEADSFIEGTWTASTGKRRRRRYCLTAAGREHLSALRGAWETFVAALFEVIGRNQP
jgi:PadR family transcriptional regulator, regulatory protein PadR